MEEEAYYEARREAARIVRLQRIAKEQQATKTHTDRSWLGDNENDWDVYVYLSFMCKNRCFNVA